MAMFIEMRRKELQGNGDWSFSKSLWAPSHTDNGRKWNFWNKIKDIKDEDIILHLQGEGRKAFFTGYSIADGDGFETPDKPANVGGWNFSETLYRARLKDFIPFHAPINLYEIFEQRKDLLNDFYRKNSLSPNKLNLFYSPREGKLGCQQGAYLSDLDQNLLNILFGETVGEPIYVGNSGRTLMSVQTSSQIRQIRVRNGQDRFAQQIKNGYDNRCCFPNCPIDDRRFLIASHIARWADNEELRGDMGNGLCLCPFHDKAFELGYFGIDENLRIILNNEAAKLSSSAFMQLRPFEGESIRRGSISLFSPALAEHRLRHNLISK